MAKFIQSGKVERGERCFPGETSILPSTGRGTSEADEGGVPLGAFFAEAPLRQRYALPPPRAGEEDQDTTIHTAMPIIIRFSVSDRKPSGTLLDPPTQAHFSSRRSI